MSQANRAAPVVSLKVLFAAEARKAVILRRGPQEHFHLISWDLNTDTFVRGQWLRGRVRLCDLSADGSRLLYWAAQYHRPRTRPSAHCYYEPSPQAVAPRRKERKVPRYVREQAAAVAGAPPLESFSTWTAVSKAPYFTALAIWPSLGTWTGGGCFGDDGAICLAEFGLDPIVNAGPPDVPIRAIPIRSEFKRSARFGDADSDPAHADVALALGAAGAERVHWVDLNPSTGVTFAYDGRVFRARAASAPEDVALSGELIADFRDMAFEQILPPATALQW